MPEQRVLVADRLPRATGTKAQSPATESSARGCSCERLERSGSPRRRGRAPRRRRARTGWARRPATSRPAPAATRWPKPCATTNVAPLRLVERSVDGRDVHAPSSHGARRGQAAIASGPSMRAQHAHDGAHVDAELARQLDRALLGADQEELDGRGRRGARRARPSGRPRTTRSPRRGAGGSAARRRPPRARGHGPRSRRASEPPRACRAAPRRRRPRQARGSAPKSWKGLAKHRTSIAPPRSSSVNLAHSSPRFENRRCTSVTTPPTRTTTPSP